MEERIMKSAQKFIVVIGTLAILVAFAPSVAAVGFSGWPSVRVSRNELVELTWHTPVAWFGRVEVFDNPTGSGSSILSKRNEDLAGNPIAARQHMVLLEVPECAPVCGGLLPDTNYFFKVTSTNPTDPNDTVSSPLPLPPFFTGAQTMGMDILAPAPNSPFQAGAEPRAIAAGDFNGDGHTDLAMVGVFQDAHLLARFSVLLNNGAGGFAPAPGSPYPLTVDTSNASIPDSLAVSDINGDGRADIVILLTQFVSSTATVANVIVLLGDGAGGFASPTRLGIDPEPGSRVFVGSDSLAIGDFNGDGHADLAITKQVDFGTGSSVLESHNEFLILLGDGTGEYNFGEGNAITIVDRVLPGSSYAPRSIKVADLNGDGHSDLAFANPATMDVSAWLNDGHANFTAAPGSPFALASGSFQLIVKSLAVADLDEDGNPDLAVSSTPFGGDAPLALLLGDGTGSFVAAQGFPSEVSPRLFPAAGDFNSDVHADLVIVEGSVISVLLGAGNGSFTRAPGLLSGFGPFAVADLNGDGSDDLAVANVDSSDVSIFLQPPVINPIAGTFNFRRFRLRDTDSPDRIQFLADYALGSGSDGINPAVEAVTIKLSTPAGGQFYPSPDFNPLSGFQVQGATPKRLWMLNAGERARTSIERLIFDEDPNNSGAILLRDFRTNLADADYSIVNVEITIGTGATADKLTGTANLVQRPAGSGRWRLGTEH
jgi:hypothetical protein